MKNRLPVEIAIAGDSNYMIPLTVLLKSIFINNVDLYITVNFLHLVNSVSKEDLQRLDSFITRHGHTMRPIAATEGQLGKLPNTRHSKNTFLRLLLPEMLPKEVNKILYFDGDVVVNGSIKSLYQLNIDNVYIAGAKDTANYFGKAHCQALNLPEDYDYFNAGVVLMNIKRIREEGLQKKFFEFIPDNIDILAGVDQDVLNATLYKAVSYFSPIYNYNFWTEKDVALQLYTKEEYEAVMSDPIIVHYIGPVKPWNYKSIHPHKALWYHYLKQTPYKDYRPVDKNLKNMISYFFLWAIIRPIKPLLTVNTKQRIGKLLPTTMKSSLKKYLFKAQ